MRMHGMRMKAAVYLILAGALCCGCGYNDQPPTLRMNDRGDGWQDITVKDQYGRNYEYTVPLPEPTGEFMHVKLDELKQTHWQTHGGTGAIPSDAVEVGEVETHKAPCEEMPRPSSVQPLHLYGLHRFIGQDGDVWLRAFSDVSECNFADGKIPDNFTIEAKDSLLGWDVAAMQWDRPGKRITSCGYSQRWWVNFGSKSDILDWAPPETPQPITIQVFFERVGDYSCTEDDLLGYTSSAEPGINESVRLELYPNVLCYE